MESWHGFKVTIIESMDYANIYNIQLIYLIKMKFKSYKPK